MLRNPNSNKPKSWKDWFLSRHSNFIINKYKKKELFKTFDNTVEKETCKRRIMDCDQTVFMFKQNLGDNRINVFHHLSRIGGNLYDKTEIFGAVQGIGDGTSCVITPDITTLLDLPMRNAEKVPKPDDIFAAKTRTDIEKLIPNDDHEYFPRNFVPIPPFLLNKVNTTLELTEGNGLATLLAVIEEIVDYDDTIIDNESEDNNDQTENARESCINLVYWLWLAVKSKIYAIPTLGCSNRTMRDFMRELEARNLDTQDSLLDPNQISQSQATQSLASLQTPIDIIAANSATTQDALVKLTELQTKSTESTTKSFKKVPPQYQHMMLVAASQGTVVATDINDNAKKFFSTPDRVQAQLFLNTLLERDGIECTVSTALTTLLSYGNFIWTSTVTPSGLSSMVISSKDLLANESILEGMVLDLSTKHEISKSALTKLTKTHILLPTDVDSMLERFSAVFTLAKLFFGTTSILVINLQIFIRQCYKEKLLLKTAHHLDEEFIAKLMYSIDDRINKWLHECVRATTVQDTSGALVEFSGILTDIKLNRFICFLPGNIKKLSKRNATLEDSNDERVKKKRKNETQIRNENMVADWKLQGNENWNKFFKGKSKEGPILSCGTHPCLKFHVKGVCYDDCSFKASHKSLEGNDVTKTNAFIKKLRRNE